MDKKFELFLIARNGAQDTLESLGYFGNGKCEFGDADSHMLRALYTAATQAYDGQTFCEESEITRLNNKFVSEDPYLHNVPPWKI